MASFSRVTIIEAIKAFGFSTHAPLDNLVPRFELETAELLSFPLGSGLDMIGQYAGIGIGAKTQKSFPPNRNSDNVIYFYS